MCLQYIKIVKRHEEKEEQRETYTGIYYTLLFVIKTWRGFESGSVKVFFCYGFFCTRLFLLHVFFRNLIDYKRNYDDDVWNDVLCHHMATRLSPKGNRLGMSLFMKLMDR